MRILDWSGALVREVRGDDGCKARWVSLDDLGDVAAIAMVAAEIAGSTPIRGSTLSRWCAR